jgi:F0F1-type ATP synthase membrane subunit b/b'
MILMSSGKPRAVLAKTLKADVDALLARTKAAVAKLKTKAKAGVAPAKAAAKPAVKDAPKTVAKPKTRGGRLIQAEREVQAAKPHDPRCVYRDMSTK